MLMNSLLTISSFLSNLSSAFFPLSSSSDEVGEELKWRAEQVETEFLINSHSIALVRFLDHLSWKVLKIKVFHLLFLNEENKAQRETCLTHIHTTCGSQDYNQGLLPLNPIYIPPQDIVILADGTKIKFWERSIPGTMAISLTWQFIWSQMYCFLITAMPEYLIILKNIYQS